MDRFNRTGRAYVSFLDGEHSKLTGRHDLPFRERFAPESRYLKAQALFGHRIAVSDIQICDSPAMLLAFADAGFLQLVQEHPDWLVLRGRPTETDPTPRLQSRIVRSGLVRMTNPGWVSSSTLDTTLVREVAHLLLELDGWGNGSPDAAAENATLRRLIAPLSPDGRLLMSGLINGIEHFTSGNRTASVERAGQATPVTYYSLLQELNGRDLLTPHARLIERLVGFIDSTIEDERARHFRSAFMATSGRHPREYDEFFPTVAHAWNLAIQRSLGCTANVHEAIPGSVPIALYLDHTTDVTIPTEYVPGTKERPQNAFYKWLLGEWGRDPSGLSWSRVREVVAKVNQQRAAYTTALGEDDEEAIAAAREALCRAIAKETTNDALPKLDTLWLTAGALVGVGGYVIGEHSPLHGALAAGGTYTVAQFAWDCAQKMSKSRREHAVMSTLLRDAKVSEDA